MLSSLDALHPRVDALGPGKDAGFNYSWRACEKFESRGEEFPKDAFSGQLNTTYFKKLATHRFLLQEGQSASKALLNFFEGPSFSDCS